MPPESQTPPAPAPSESNKRAPRVSSKVRAAAQLLGRDGPFALTQPGFKPREAQLVMAQAVEQAIEDAQTLVVEAGTGTGKTFAYLVPALESGKRVVLATGTKNLQEQLFYRDLPKVTQLLGRTTKRRLLKGRNNYLCLYRLEQAMEAGQFISRDVVNQLHQVNAWATKTTDGDLAHLEDLPEDAPVIPSVTSTGDNCLGQECPYIEQCFVAKARKQAMEADVLVINHHLLLADFVLKEDGFGELLPQADLYVVDEAHQLPEVANQFFGERLSSRQMIELARDMEVAYRTEAKDVQGLKEAADALQKWVAEVRLHLGERASRRPWHEFARHPQVATAVEALITGLQSLAKQLEKVSTKSKSLESCWRRALEFHQNLRLLTQAQPKSAILWVDVFTKGFSFNATPIEVGADFAEQMREQGDASWVFTSATLAVGKSLAHYCERLGLQPQQSLLLDSPFDYQQQSLLYVPRDLPEPQSPDYTDRVVEAAIPVLQASGGRAFVLFTSHRALQQAKLTFAGRLDFPILSQGEAGKTELLQRFCDLGNAILLATGSFWEGVDIPGSALSCVIIDKLPFASPQDPVLQARLNQCRQKGGDPFSEIQIPQAAIGLKQGCGRLIRATGDKGLVMICDPRMVNRAYGKVLLQSLPDMPRTRSQELACGYLKQLD